MIPFFQVRKVVFLLICTVCLLSKAKGQEKGLDSLYVWHDEQMGIVNTGIYAATEYVEQYQVINEKHRFLDSPNFLLGTIWYAGDPFHKVLMKYDLFEDQVIISLKNSASVPPIKLESQKIDSFQLKDRKFIKASFPDPKSNLGIGFYQLINRSAYFTFYEKHRKVDVRKLNRNRVYYEFKDKNEYIVVFEGQFFNIKNKKDLLNIFPLEKSSRKKLQAMNTGRSLNEYSINFLLQEIKRELKEKSKPEDR